MVLGGSAVAVAVVGLGLALDGRVWGLALAVLAAGLGWGLVRALGGRSRLVLDARAGTIEMTDLGPLRSRTRRVPLAGLRCASVGRLGHDPDTDHPELVFADGSRVPLGGVYFRGAGAVPVVAAINGWLERQGLPSGEPPRR